MSEQYEPNWRSAFLSYNRRDEGLATHLYRFLVSIGVDVWFAPVHCNPLLEGNDLNRLLEAEIKKRDLVILLATQNSLQQSYGVERETNYLGYLEGEEGTIDKLILVTFSDEVPDKAALVQELSDTGLNRFHQCDLISVKEMEHASEHNLQWYLNKDLPI